MAYIRIQEQAEPDTPPSGRIIIYVDSTSGLLSMKDDTGTVSTFGGATIHAAPDKATLVDADEIAIANSATGFILNHITYLNLKVTLKTYFDTLYDFVTSTHAATSKATPVDADELGLLDSATSFSIKKLTWVNLKVTLKTYFDTLYASVTSTFTSSDQTITSGGLLVLAHSLGSIPLNIRIFLVCQTSELGYTAGQITPWYSGVRTASDNQGLAIVPDSTNLNIRFGSNANPIAITRFDTGASANITTANWKMRFIAKVSL